MFLYVLGLLFIVNVLSLIDNIHRDMRRKDFDKENI